MTCMRSLALLGVLAAAPGFTLAAQTGTTDPVLKRMWTLGMDSSHTWDLAQVLFDSIGPRLTGTPQGTQASDWVIKTYKSWGIDAKREQYGTWRGWRRGVSHIDLIKPRIRSLEATILGYSPNTGGKDLVAGTIILPMVQDSNEFVKWLPNAKGNGQRRPRPSPRREWTRRSSSS
jgi:carboxypeptidase Q